MKRRHKAPERLAGSFSGWGRKVKPEQPPPAALPDGIWLRDGRPMFACRACDQATEWEGDLADFELTNPTNVCGRSPRCCP